LLNDKEGSSGNQGSGKKRITGNQGSDTGGILNNTGIMNAKSILF